MKFEAILKYFITDIIPYFASIRVITACRLLLEYSKFSERRYRHEFSEREIFRFDFMRMSFT